MKYLLFGSLLLLSACSGGGFGIMSSTGSGEKIENVIIPLPTAKCGYEECFRASYAMTGAGAGEMWSFAPEAHGNYKSYVNLINDDLQKIDVILKEARINSCSALPASGELDAEADHDLVLQFKEPTFGFAMDADSFLDMQKRMTVLKAGTPLFDIEMHCGALSGVKTLALIWLNGPERVHLYYRVDGSSGAIELVGGQKDGPQNWLFGFKNDPSGGFRFISLNELAGSYYLINMQTDPSDPTALEYVAQTHSNAPSTASMNSIPYGAAVDTERVCARNYKNNVPTFSYTPADCNTSTMHADVSNWFAIVGMNSGTIWTTDYLSQLDLPDPSDY